jgi:hypothetical protein
MHEYLRKVEAMNQLDYARPGLQRRSPPERFDPLPLTLALYFCAITPFIVRIFFYEGFILLGPLFSIFGTMSGLLSIRSAANANLSLRWFFARLIALLPNFGMLCYWYHLASLCYLSFPDPA